jgi:hypothetical protein
MSRNIMKKPYCKVCQDAGKPESEYTSHWVKSMPDHSGKTIITCPILLSTECRFCGKLGHTTKFCPVVEQNKKEKEKAERQKMFEVSQKISNPKPLKSSGFDLLAEESSDSETEVNVSKPKTTITEDFPALGPKKIPQRDLGYNEKKPSFAYMVTKRSDACALTGFLHNPFGENVILRASKPVREPIREPVREPNPVHQIPVHQIPFEDPIRRVQFAIPEPVKEPVKEPNQAPVPNQKPVIRGYYNRRQNWADCSDSDDEDD